jgi:anti-anti-sigma regulatory factor
MDITIMNNQGPAPVTILRLDGKLDGTSYEALISVAQKAYDSGTRDLILDLSKLTFISSAGLAGLHTVALIFQGEKHPNQDEGWASYHAIDRDRDKGVQEHVILFSPTEHVRQVLDLVGFSAFFGIYTDSDLALASFQPAIAAAEAR